MIILIDGPEKAGKTTLITELARVLNAKVRRWGPVSPDDRVYSVDLKTDAESPNWVIWDRGWPSEHVYGKLLGRDRRLATDPWLGEWLHGRAVQTSGLRVILLPEHVNESVGLRDETDLKVDGIEEYHAFRQYGNEFGYLMLSNNYTRDRLRENVNAITSRCGHAGVLQAKDYAGPPNAKVVFVDNARSKSSKPGIPGAWLPFTSKLTTELGRRLGPKAFNYGWTNIGSVHQSTLANRYVIACGEQAAEWLDNSGIMRLVIPHPSQLYRFSTSDTYAKRDLIDKVFSAIGEL